MSSLLVNCDSSALLVNCDSSKLLIGCEAGPCGDDCLDEYYISFSWRIKWTGVYLNCDPQYPLDQDISGSCSGKWVRGDAVVSSGIFPEPCTYVGPLEWIPATTPPDPIVPAHWQTVSCGTGGVITFYGGAGGIGTILTLLYDGGATPPVCSSYGGGWPGSTVPAKVSGSSTCPTGTYSDFYGIKEYPDLCYCEGAKAEFWVTNITIS